MSNNNAIGHEAIGYVVETDSPNGLKISTKPVITVEINDSHLAHNDPKAIKCPYCNSTNVSDHQKNLSKF